MKHRKILSILLAAATAVSVAGCSKNETSGSESSAPDDSSSPAGVQTASNVSANGWEFNQVAMGGGGFVSGVFATSQEGLYYARTDVGGAYRYNKDTQLWESMSYGISEDDQGFLGIAGLAYGDKDPNRVYLLAGTSYLSGGRTALFISNDYGSTFTRTELTDYINVDGNGMGRGNGERLAVDPKNSDIVYAAGMSSGGLIKSTDGGQTFSYLDLGTDTNTNNNSGICSILIDPQSGDDSSCSTIYAAISRKGDYNLYKSTDAGATWAPVEDAPKGLMVQRMKYNGDGKIVLTYASTEGPWNNPRGNGGIRLLNIADDSITDITPEKNGYGDVVIDPANPDRMVAVTENVYDQQANGTFGDDFYVTTDGGKTWKNINLDMTMSGGDVSWHNESSMHWCSSLAIDPHNTGKIMVVSGNGIFSCDNIWDEHPAFYFFAEGIEETVPYELVSIPGGELVTVVGDYDGFTQDDAAEPTIDDELPKEKYGDIPDGVTPYTYYVRGGSLYYAENRSAVPFTGGSEPRIKAMCGILDRLNEVTSAQKKGCSDDELKMLQSRLNNTYDGFVKKYGHLNSRSNTSAFADDIRAPRLTSIENVEELPNGKQQITKADIFTQRTINVDRVPAHVDTALEALHLSINLKQTVDLEYISQLCGKDKDAVISELGGHIYCNPAKNTGGRYSGWETAEEYLSGHVCTKAV